MVVAHPEWYKLIIGWPSSLLKNIIEASATGTSSPDPSKCFLKRDIERMSGLVLPGQREMQWSADG